MGLAIADARLGAHRILIATPKATQINGSASAPRLSRPIPLVILKRAATRPNETTHLKISFAGSSLRLTERTISQIKVAKAPSNINRPAAMERARGMAQPSPTRRPCQPSDKRRRSNPAQRLTQRRGRGRILPATVGRFRIWPSYRLFRSGLREWLIDEFGSGRTRVQLDG